MSWRLSLVATVVGALGAGLAHTAQRSADAVRRDIDVAQELLFAPQGEVLRVASLDHHMLAADVLWLRSVLEFGARFDQARDDRWAEWFSRSIRAITALDPRWRTPYVYGGIMLKVVGAPEVSTEIFKLGSERLPNDYYLPFSVGMNYYLEESNNEEAAEWLLLASKRPGAPAWYAVAAVAFREQEKERQQAIHYLRDEIDSTADPRLKQLLERRLNLLIHDEIAELFDGAVSRYTERLGRPPADINALLSGGFIVEIPEDPMGEGWVIDIDGHVRSTVIAREQAGRDLKHERSMLTARK